MLNPNNGAIGVVSSERNNFSWDFIISLINLKGKNPSCPIIYCQIGTIDAARNYLLLQAIKYKFDWIIMVDSDMTFPSDGAEKLLKTMEKFGADIGAANYFKGSKPHDSTAFDWDEDLQGYKPIKDWSEKRYIDACGMGFTLISKNAFHTSFDFVKLNNRLLGEDMTFCHRAREKGMKIVLDPTIPIGHLRMVPINEEYIRKNV